MSLMVRQAKVDDFESVYLLVNQLQEKVFDKEKQRNIYLENLKTNNCIYLLAIDVDNIIGFLSCHFQKQLHHSGEVGEIVEMIVEKTHRNMGIGEKLVTEIIKIAKNRDSALLEVTSNKRRVAAHRFYQKVGFAASHEKFTFNLH